MSRFVVLLRALLLIAPIIGAVPSSLRGQQVDTVRRGAGVVADTAQARRLLEARLGRSVTQAEIVEQLRQSGLTREQARTRLLQMGYDPSLVDPYYDILEGGAPAPVGTADDSFVRALRSIGVSAGTPDPMRYDAVPAAGIGPAWAEELGEDTVAPGELEVFGRALFRRRTTQFDPVTTGPVDAGYRLGPGDEIVLILTGDIELAYQLPVTREGYFIIPDVGQVFVNGLTLRELEDRLYDRLSRVYSGVRRGPEATTRFQVSLGRLRVNQVYLVGEVTRPGAYTVSSAATVFHALHRAGGPNENGSFREIRVLRGDSVVRKVDLYEYLLRGDSRSDIRLEQGDIVFVPPYAKRVRVEGAVRRPAIYEVLEGERLDDVLGFAGGFDASASVRRIQIDRILPPERRRPGVERVLVDVDVAAVLSGSGQPVELRDGDVVQVFAVAEERRHRVTVTGEVRRPGSYEWAEGQTLWELIERADGLAERAYTPRGHIYRLNEVDGSRRLISTPLLADSSGRPVADVLLADRDSVVIFSRERLRNPEMVTIDGFVKNPGTYELAEGMTVQDLILAAGGFTPGAYTAEAEVARFPDGVERTDRTAAVIRVPLVRGADGAKAAGGIDTSFAAAGGAEGRFGDRAVSAATVGAGRPAWNEIPVWEPEPEAFTLRHGDRVFIRKAPGYEAPRAVAITGQVMIPGTYILENRQERLLDLIERAGGLTSEAYAPGLQLFRDSSLVATDLPKALADPAGRYNIVLQAGDSLHLPEYDPTVLVTGAVTFESRVLYEPGKGLDYYINRAGGYTDLADRGRVTVTYQDGERAAVERSFLLFRRKPELQPGSTIYVPAKPESERGGFNWGEFVTRSSTVLTTFATLLLAVSQLK
jgi:protein involved in polysaccharide export with SLBB domain